jgi:hypothetical protein
MSACDVSGCADSADPHAASAPTQATTSTALRFDIAANVPADRASTA